MKVVKKFGEDFTSSGGALTLSPSDVGAEGRDKTGHFSTTHADGWTITGYVHEDHFRWVNDFEATHEKYGKVWGNFEDEVHADCEEGFQHFWDHHQPEAWDYGDI